MSGALPRSRAALSALDAHDATIDGIDTNDAAGAWLARADGLSAGVGRAFALDTAAYNSEADCMALCAHSGGIAWLREVVARC